MANVTFRCSLRSAWLLRRAGTPAAGTWQRMGADIGAGSPRPHSCHRAGDRSRGPKPLSGSHPGWAAKAARKQSRRDVLIQLTAIYFVLVSASPPGDLLFHRDVPSPVGDPDSGNLFPPQAGTSSPSRLAPKGCRYFSAVTRIEFYWGESA